MLVSITDLMLQCCYVFTRTWFRCLRSDVLRPRFVRLEREGCLLYFIAGAVGRHESVLADDSFTIYYNTI